MAKYKFLLIFFLSLLTQAQDKMPETELLVRRFIHALIDKDEARIKALCLDHHNIKSLWQGQAKPEAERDELKRELNKLDIDWLEEGDSFRFGGKVFSVNENMISKRHQIARVKMIEYGFPIHLSKVGGNWYIQPLFIVNVYQREIAIESKKNRRNYTVTIDGVDIPLNEEEEGSYTLSNGQKLKVSMRKNLYQNFEDSKVHISYSRDLDINKSIDRNCIVYRLSGELSTNLMIQIYDKGSTLETVQKYVTNSFIENYRSMEYTLEETPLRNGKIIRKNKVLEGKDLYSKRNDVIHLDRFFFWEEKGCVIGVVMQTEMTDSVAGRDYLNHIINELEIKSI